MYAVITPRTLGRRLDIFAVDPAAANVGNSHSIALSFYPTALTPLGNGKFILAGTTLHGATIVQEIQLSPTTVVMDVDTGHGVIQDMTIVSNTLLYNETSLVRKHVIWAVPSPHDNNSSLVQFFSSKDIYSIDRTTKQYFLVASSTQGGGALVIPELATRDYNFGWSRRHADHGGVCVLNDMRYRTYQEALVLFDANLDGIFEQAMLLDDVAWKTMGMSDSTKWL